MEVVHVELADKGAEVGVAEVLGKNLFGKGEWVEDDESDVVLIPADDAFVVRVLDTYQFTSSI